MVKKIRKKKRVMFYSKKGDIESNDYSDGSRSIIMSSELEEAFKEQRKLFIEEFGREPSPDDPIFFDPDADIPQPYSEEKFKEQINSRHSHKELGSARCPHESKIDKRSKKYYKQKS